MKNIFNRFVFLIAFCGLFVSCSNFSTSFYNEVDISKGKGKICISTDLQASRSVLPTAITDTTTRLKWELNGTKDGTQKQIQSWVDDTDGTTAYKKMVADTSIFVDVGEWKFTLTASTAGKNVLNATISATINAGENSLNFVMQEATDDNAASGSIEFTLKFPKEVVGNVVATLYKYDNDNTVVDTNRQLTIDESSNNNFDSVKYSYPNSTTAELKSGYYILKIELQQSNGSITAPTEEYKTINTYSCLVRVAPGLTSKGEYTLDKLAQLYTVTYEVDEGIFDSATTVTTSYNEYTTFALPTIKEEEGYEYQWYKTVYSNSSSQESVDDPSNVRITEDTTFGVKCYKIVDKKDIVRTAKGVSTGDSFSIGTAEGLAIFRDLVNGSHENLKMVDKSGETEEVFVYYKTGLVNYKSQLNAKLTSDIDLTQLNELSWVPINGYSGTFDGGGHTITVNNTYYSNEGVYYQGLFDTLDGATIKNLVVAGEETISESGLEYCGGIVSQIKNERGVDTTFENCVNKRNITVTGVERIGGFAGYTSSNNSETTNFVNCINLGTIENNYNASEYYDPYVAGFTTGATSYAKCINAGNVTGATYLDNSDGAASGTVAGFDASVSANFEDCINLGDISANSYTADDEKIHSTDKVYGFSSIDEYNSPTFTYCIDAGSAKQPFTGVVDNTIGTYKTCYYNSDSYGSNYNTDVLSCMSSNDLCKQEKTDFSNWSYDSSHYPLPDIVKSETTEGVSSEIWQEVVAKAIPKVSNFTMLKERIASASGTAENPEVIVLNGTINIAEKLEITTPIKIIASTSAGTTITRGADDSGKVFTGAFFDNQSTLTLEGITLDGGKDLQIQATAPLITSSRSLTLNNCTLQNNKNTSDTPGGAINISAGTFTMNGGVIGEVISEDVESKKSWEYPADADNYSNYAEAGGGGIYVASGDVTIDNATISYNYTPNIAKNFENKTPSDTAHGGGISIVSGSLSLKGSEVSYNSGYQGGGIRCYQNSDNSSENILTLEKSKIIGNISNPYYCNGFGGGVMVKNFTVKFEGETPSVIEENFSGDGGALFLENTNSILQNTTSTLQNITIQNNSYNKDGYKNGSEVLLYSGANVSIGSSNVTIQSAAGETRGIFMNNNNTLNLSGDAKLDTPIYLTNGAKVTVSAALTSEGTVATITPQYYPGDTYLSDNVTITVEKVQVLTVGTGVTLSNDIVGRFAVTPQTTTDGTTINWTINTEGKIANNAALNGTIISSIDDLKSFFNATNDVYELSGETYVLKNNIILDYPLYISGSKNVIIGANTNIELSASFTNNNLIIIETGTLTLGNGAGCLTLKHTSDNKSTIALNGVYGELTLEDNCAITGSQYCAIEVLRGSVTMNGGEIYGNKYTGSNTQSSAVTFGEGDNIYGYFYGGRIYSNETSASGGAIAIMTTNEKSVCFTIDNTEIYSNTAADYGGGVYSKNSNLYIYSGAKIYDNVVDGTNQGSSIFVTEGNTFYLDNIIHEGHYTQNIGA